MLTQTRLHPRSLLSIGLLLACVVVIGPPGATGASAETRTASRVYLAGTGQDVDCGSSQGGACFPLTGDEAEASITVVDDSGRQPASANFEFRGTGGQVLGGGSFCDAAVTEVPAEATQLAVMVAAADPVGCDAPSVGSTGKVHLRTSTAEGVLELRYPEPQECLEPTPAAISVGGLTEPEDEGQRVSLDVYVLLDGIEEEHGRTVMTKAAEAYEPLGIDLRADLYPVSLPAGNGMLMLSHSMNAVGGEVPEGYDLVHTLTDKSMNVWGQADCIGGIRYRDRAFSVSTGTLEDRPVSYLGPVQGRTIENLAANIVAHEIGHLMGGHHHLGNCVESQLERVESCTVMMDPGDPKLLLFSTANGAIVRAHAVRYADANTADELATITATVLRNGRAIEGAQVTATHADREGASCVTTAEGECALRVEAGDGYSVTARTNPGPQGARTAHDVTAPGTVTFEFGQLGSPGQP